MLVHDQRLPGETIMAVSPMGVKTASGPRSLNLEAALKMVEFLRWEVPDPEGLVNKLRLIHRTVTKVQSAANG